MYKGIEAHGGGLSPKMKKFFKKDEQPCIFMHLSAYICILLHFFSGCPTKTFFIGRKNFFLRRAKKISPAEEMSLCLTPNRIFLQREDFSVINAEISQNALVIMLKTKWIISFLAKDSVVWQNRYNFAAVNRDMTATETILNYAVAKGGTFHRRRYVEFSLLLFNKTTIPDERWLVRDCRLIRYWD